MVLVGNEQKGNWDLQQIPEVNGAMMALDPHTGRVLAISGGYAYGSSEFDRARRRPNANPARRIQAVRLFNGAGKRLRAEYGDSRCA